MTELIRGLGFVSALSLVVGSMIGTGVFLKTATMAQSLGSTVLVLAAWVVAGLLSLAGSFSYAEVGSRFPQAGGEYIYVQKSYGRLPAFLYGWTRFWIASPGSLAAYAVGAATFLSAVTPLDPVGGRTVVALFFLAAFTWMNCLQVKFGGGVQAFMTFLKFFLLLGIVAGVFFFSPTKSLSHLNEHLPQVTASFSSFGTAMLAALWAYDGWNNLPMAAGEVKNPGRNIPLALTTGTVAVLGIYLAVNFSYFVALPFEAVATSNSTLYKEALPVASRVVEGFWGPRGVTFLSLLFVFSALGAMNGSMLTSARVPYAMAKDDLFVPALARLNPKTHVPTTAILVQGLTAAVLAVWGTFDQLTDWVVFSSWIFYALVTFSLFTLRKRSDVPPATFHTPGYPVIPAIFCFSAIALLVNTIVTNPKETLCGVAFIALGVPVYWVLQLRRIRKLGLRTLEAH